MRDNIKILAAILGFSGVLVGAILGVIYLMLPWVMPSQQARQVNTFLAAIALPSLVLGGALAREAINALDGRPSARPNLPPVVILLLLYAGVLLLGPGALRDGKPGAYIFPVLFVLAIALPLLMILRVVVHRTPAVVSRETTLQLVYGSLIGTTVAFVIEAVVFVGLIVGALAVASVLPGGRAWLDEVSRLASGSAPPDPARFQQLILNPAVLAVLTLGTMIAGPLVEELAKVLGVVAMGYRRPTRGQAFAWGIAAGAGFALAEGLLSAVMLAGEWPQGVVARAGASLLHATLTGIVALGWFESSAHRRMWAFPLAYLTAAAIHGWWNGLVLGSAAAAMAGTSGAIAASTAASLAAGLGSVLALTAVALMLIFVTLTLWATGREAAPASPAPEMPVAGAEL